MISYKSEQLTTLVWGRPKQESPVGKVVMYSHRRDTPAGAEGWNPRRRFTSSTASRQPWPRRRSFRATAWSRPPLATSVARSVLLRGCLAALAAGLLLLCGGPALAAGAVLLSSAAGLAALLRSVRRVGDLRRALLGHPLVLQRFVLLLVLDVGGLARHDSSSLGT